MSTGWDGPPQQGQPPYGGQGYPQQGGYPPQQGGYPPYGGGGGYGQPPYGGTGPQGYYGQPPQKGNGGKIVAIVTTIVVVLAGVGVALYFLVFNKSDSNSTASPKDTVTSFMNDAKANDEKAAENLLCPDLKALLTSDSDSSSDSSSSGGGGLFDSGSDGSSDEDLKSFSVHDAKQTADEWDVPVDLTTNNGKTESATFVVQQTSGKYLICDIKEDGESLKDALSGLNSDDPYSDDPYSDDPYSDDPYSDSDSF